MENKSMLVQRNDSLDYLRGLAASGVMAYHLSLLSFGESDASSLIAKVKIFAVSIFYVLSGLTLFIANKKITLQSKESLIQFYTKRFFRIFPLIWLATFCTYVLHFSPEMLSPKFLAVNITILPGMLRPDAFVANGAWSIGNELFFYVCFPLLFTLHKKNKWYLIAAVAFSFFVFCVFSYRLITPSIQLGFQWSKYVNPLNQFFYFAIGIYLATLAKPAEWLTKWAVPLMLLAAVGIVWYPISGEPVVLVTGHNRLLLSALVIAICYLFSIANFDFLPTAIKTCLKFLGDTSFSIYLLHPLLFAIFELVSSKVVHLHPYTIIGATVVSTLILSHFVYLKFEKYFMQRGKVYIDKRKQQMIQSQN